MCRLISYLGMPEIMSKLLYEPENSIIKQSYVAKKIEEPLNGDGFRVSWYMHQKLTEHQEFLFRSRRPGTTATYSTFLKNQNQAA